MKIRRTRLMTKLGRVVALQVVLLSATVAAGIYITNTIVEDFLITEALQNEASHYWSLYEQDPNHPLPNTANMRGYLVNSAVSPESTPRSNGIVPEQLLQHPAGFLGRVSMNEESPTLFVSQQSDDIGPRLYLVFFSEDVSQLAFYFGILPLSLALLLVYGFSFLTYRLSHRAISPIVKLADYLQDFRFGSYNQPAVDLGDLRALANLEVDVMIDSIDSFAERLDTFIERERIFTRDASHELRTPIAVFKGSLDLLQRKSDRSEDDVKAFARMRRTVDDMEGLIETLLLLARGEEVERIHEIRCLNELIPGYVEQLVPMAAERGLDLSIDEQAQLWVKAPSRVIQIILTNLLRNALNYTQQGSVIVRIRKNTISVIDTGIGMSPEELQHAFEPFYRGERSRASSMGHGLGLSIVRRLVHQFDWLIHVQSNVGKGTEVTIEFFEG
ncbi:MAG: HAMP domain-containing histidine kinase [Luminiphilus sp.]|nr:HAMP domain-containing histidine kinase [Pseudomonadales bacterium]MBL6824170.1 HAMP domain-containing histidine kinase [Luminiphilus sp.]